MLQADLTESRKAELMAVLTDDSNKTTHDYLWGEFCDICGSDAGEECRPGCVREPCPGCGYPWRGECICDFGVEQCDDEYDAEYDLDRYAYQGLGCPDECGRGSIDRSGYCGENDYYD